MSEYQSKLVVDTKTQRASATRINDLWTEFEDIAKGRVLKHQPDLRLATLRVIRSSLALIEADIAKTNKATVADLRELRLLLPKVEAAISRCEAGAKKRTANAEAKR